jgi:ABC-type oligopeptide transport system substrate-binding subunit
MEVKIPEEVTEAINDAFKDVAPDAVKAYIQQLRRHISPEEIREKATQLLDSEELRKEVAVQQVFLTLDLYEIQMANWADILKSTKESLEEVLSLRVVEIKAANEKARVLREVELAEVLLHKTRAEEDWDIALLRFRKIKGHLIVGALLLVLGVFIGQAIESARHPAQVVHPKGQKK